MVCKTRVRRNFIHAKFYAMTPTHYISSPTNSRIPYLYSHFVIGVRSICSNLAQNKCLTHLNVEYNDVGPISACILAGALRTNRTVKTICLAGNSIGELGARAILRSMKYDIDGRFVDLTSCDFSKTHWADVRMKDTKFGKVCDRSIGLFDFNDPVGYYKLDMEKPYNQFIATELHHLASLSSCYYFKQLKHNGTDVNLVAPPPLPQRSQELQRTTSTIDLKLRFSTRSYM